MPVGYEHLHCPKRGPVCDKGCVNYVRSSKSHFRQEHRVIHQQSRPAMLQDMAAQLNVQAAGCSRAGAVYKQPLYLHVAMSVRHCNTHSSRQCNRLYLATQDAVERAQQVTMYLVTLLVCSHVQYRWCNTAAPRTYSARLC